MPQALATLLLIMITAPSVAAAPAPRVFRYQNPISDGLDPHGVRDCQVFRDGDKWYMVPTSWPHWPRQEKGGHFNPGIVLYSSDHLVNWRREGVLVARPSPEKWYLERFWAPEVHKIAGKYYATFNCSNPARGYPGQHFGYAVADRLLGPYRVVTEARPLGSGNDFTLFPDDDGRIWAFWNQGREFGIGFAQLDLATGRFLTEPRSAIQPGRLDYATNSDGSPALEPGYDGRPQRKVARAHEWDSIGIEGAFVVKRTGTYYLFYSSWTRGYEIGYATASRISGPWTKASDNPFYGEQSEASCRKNNIPYTGRGAASPFNQVGHNEIFTGPDGRLWLSCHGILKTAPDRPLLVIDPIDFDARGRILPRTPSHTPQEIALP